MPTYIPPENARRLNYHIYLAEASIEARGALCLTRHVGAVVVRERDGKIFGRGANFPPDSHKPETCNKTCIPKEGGPNDRHCCMHAEQVALARADHRGGDLPQCLLIFADIDKDGRVIPAGKPYCTQCSKWALFYGIKGWVCYHAEGVWPKGEGFYRYTAREMNDLSFAFRDPAFCLCRTCANKSNITSEENHRNMVSYSFFCAGLCGNGVMNCFPPGGKHTAACVGPVQDCEHYWEGK